MKDELHEKIMKEFVAWRTKTYSYLKENDDEDKEKKKKKKIVSSK